MVRTKQTARKSTGGMYMPSSGRRDFDTIAPPPAASHSAAASGVAAARVQKKQKKTQIAQPQHEKATSSPSSASLVIPDGGEVPERLWREILVAEEAKRLSPAVQAKFAELERERKRGNDGPDWEQYVSEVLQPGLLREFSVAPGPINLTRLRRATVDFPALADIPMYVRFNRAERGSLRAGDAAPDCSLVAVEGGGETLLSALVGGENRPLVICGASWS
jgi:hypothetical protein